MKSMAHVASALAGAALLLSVAAPVQAQGPGYPEVSRDEEIRLAMSAGPPTISGDADIYVMGEDGFRKEIQGTNGWSCLVTRNASNRIQLAPHCLNPEATESVLPSMLFESNAQAEGWDGEAIQAEVIRRYESGEWALPSGPAYAYMMSEGQILGSNGGNFFPHFMLYKPYTSNEEIGGSLERMEYPFVGPYENHPLSTVVILMPEFVSPADMVPPGR